MTIIEAWAPIPGAKEKKTDGLYSQTQYKIARKYNEYVLLVFGVWNA